MRITGVNNIIQRNYNYSQIKNNNQTKQPNNLQNFASYPNANILPNYAQITFGLSTKPVIKTATRIDEIG